MPETIQGTYDGAAVRDWRLPSLFSADSAAEVPKISLPVNRALALTSGAGYFEAYEFDSSLPRAGASTADSFPAAATSVQGRWRRAPAGPGVNVRLYGATGDGVTNDTPAFTAALAAMTDGMTLWIPPGTYCLDNLLVSKDIFWLADAAAIFKHCAPTNDMIRFAVPQSYGMEGGIYDGNKTDTAADATDAAWRFAVYYFSNGAHIRHARFRNAVRGAFADYQFTTSIFISNCLFENTREWPDETDPSNPLGRNSQSLVLNPQVGTRPHASIALCEFRQPVPAADSHFPVGAVLAGTNVAGTYLSCSLSSCVFRNLSAINFYEDCVGVNCEGNIMSGCTRYAIRVLASSQCVIRGNYCQGNRSDGFDGIIRFDSHEHAEGTEVNGNILIESNIVEGSSTSSSIGINCGSDNALYPGYDISVRGNIVSGVKTCIRAARFTGSTTLESNRLTASVDVAGAACILLEQISNATAYIKDNEMRVLGTVNVGSGLLATNSVSTCDVVMDGNSIVTETAGRGIIAYGLNRLFLRSGEFTNKGGSVAYTLASAGAINELHFDRLEVAVLQGVEAIAWANVGLAVGDLRGSGSPDGVITASVGATYLRTDASSALVYDKATTSGPNGWRVRNIDHWSYYGGSTTLLLSDSHVGVDATAGNLTISLPSPAGIIGKRYVVSKIDYTANSVTVDTGTPAIGTFRLAAGHMSVAVISEGTYWRPETDQVQRQCRTLTASLSLSRDDDTLLCDTTLGAVTAVLPNPAEAAGRIFRIKKISADGNAAIFSSAATIDGAATVSTTTQWAVIAVQSSGSAYFRL